MYLFGTKEELLLCASRLKVMRFIDGIPFCLRCDDPIAWVVAHPLTLEILYVDENTEGARPVGLCMYHRDIERGVNAKVARGEQDVFLGEGR
jgi:hypothetical protein